MKHIFESPEVFQAYARIDFAYWQLKELQSKMYHPGHGLNRLIDEATGYDVAQYKLAADTAIQIMTDMIEDKKFVGADTETDEKMLTEIVQYREFLNKND